MPRIRWTCFLLCAMPCAAALQAQTQAPNGQSSQLKPRTPEQREQAYMAQRRINLHVAVTDAAGKPVTGLKAADFTILDRDRSQKVAQFDEVNGATVADDYVHGVVVLDAINGGSGGVNRVRKELVKLLGQGKEPMAYPLKIVVASDTGNNEGQPATDRTALIKDLTELTRNIHSTDCDATAPGSDLRNSRIGAEFLGQDAAYICWNCLNSHLTESMNALNLLAQEQQNEKDRAILIWTSSGWPLPPKMGTGQIMGGGTLGDLSDTIFTLEAAMQQDQVNLEAVSWGKFERAQGIRKVGLQASLKGATLAEQEAALELPALAQQTGGLALEKSKNLAEALNASLADGKQYYSIACDPPPASAQDEYRSIEVKVDRPGASVRTLTGYYTQP